MGSRRMEGPTCPEQGCKVALRPLGDGRMGHGGFHFMSWQDPADGRARYSWWGTGPRLSWPCDVEAVKEATIAILVRRYTGGTAVELVTR